jgi:broad specificity phosphatase PhoE
MMKRSSTFVLLIISLLLALAPWAESFSSAAFCVKGEEYRRSQACFGRISPLCRSSGSNDVVVGPYNIPPIPPTSRRLFLVRHGQVINPGGDRAVYYGAMDVPLSPRGEAEAKAAGKYLNQFDLELVVSSPLSRAIFGAEQVLSGQRGDRNKEIVVKDGFKELDRGSWCGQTTEEIGADLMARFNACDESVTPDGGGESYPFLKARVLAARDEVLEMLSPGRAAAIVSHIQVTRSMLSEALRIPIEEMAALAVATASVTCIDYDIVTASQTVHFQSFKPDDGVLDQSTDKANKSRM